MNRQLLTQTLAASFGALADQVQSLADRKTILEHKLRYAHEQVGVAVISLMLLPLKSSLFS